MPALPFTPSTLKAEFIGSYQGTTWAVIHHAEYGGAAPSVANLQTLATAWSSAFTAAFLTGLASQHCSLTEIILTDLSNATGARYQGAISGAGTATSADLPASVALGVSWTISQRYRGGHPRSYIPGATQGWLATGSVNKLAATFLVSITPQVTGYIAAVNALTLGGVNLIFCAVNYWQYGAHPPTLRPQGVPKAITGAAIHPRLDTQRRRLGKETI